MNSMSHSIQENAKDDHGGDVATELSFPERDRSIIRTIFELPEKIMRIFRVIIISICKHPIIYLLGYLALLCVIIVTSFTLKGPRSISVYQAYQPTFYKHRFTLSRNIEKNWRIFQNHSHAEVDYDQFRICFLRYSCA